MKSGIYVIKEDGTEVSVATALDDLYTTANSYAFKPINKISFATVSDTDWTTMQAIAKAISLSYDNTVN